MSHTTTTELSLRKDGADEAIVNFRGVTNDNLDIIDSAYGQSLDNVASVEGSTASTNHAVGTYLIQNGILYRVTSAIASGETITPGTNVTVTTLNDAVVSLNSAIATLQDSVNSHEFLNTSGTVLAEAMARRYIGISTFFQRGTAFSDAPSTAEGTYVVMGHDIRLTVFFVQYVKRGANIWCRDVHGQAWFNEWRLLSV